MSMLLCCSGKFSAKGNQPLHSAWGMDYRMVSELPSWPYSSMSHTKICRDGKGWFLLKTQLLSLLLQPANISGSGKGLNWKDLNSPGRTPRRAARWDETPATAPEPQWDFLVGRFWLLGDLSIFHRWDVAFEGEECNTSSLFFCPFWFPAPRNFKLHGWILVEQQDSSI